MAPTKKTETASKTGKKYYVPTGKPRGRKPGSKSKKTIKRERAAEMRKKGGIVKKD